MKKDCLYFSGMLLICIVMFSGCGNKQRENVMKSQKGFAEVNGTRLYYETAGIGHPLVLVHGGLMDHRMWDDQFQRFVEHFRVIRYDVRGYNQSAKTEATFSHVADLHHLLRFLEIEKTHVLGLSLGGQIAVDFTLEHPEMVTSLVVAASALTGFPYADVENYAEKFGEICEQLNAGKIDTAVKSILNLSYFVPVEENPALQPKMKEMIRANYETWSAPQDLLIWTDPPAYGRLAEITCPVLVLAGDHDVSDILNVADYLTDGIDGAEKVIISDAGHHINMEQPAAFNKAVLDFLKM